jgi:RNA polymerase sigma factor (TIGR02999 family)
MNYDSRQESARWLPEVYEELRCLAASGIAGFADWNTLQPTALVHEAWLKITARQDRRWNDRQHFFRSAALAMRRILAESARRKLRRSNARLPLELQSQKEPAESPEEKLLLIDEGLKHLEKENPRSAQVVLLKFFGGLTNAEVAETLHVTERTVERDWTHARSWLLARILSQQQHTDIRS